MVYIKGKPSNNYNDRRNFYLKKGKAYLFNQILVRKIYVYNIPIFVTPTVFKKYFEHFGKLTECTLSIQHNHNQLPAELFQIGFVLFKRAEDAACALQSSHELYGRALGIRAAHAWHQPEDNKVRSEPWTRETPTDDKLNFHILDLTPLNIAQLLEHSNLRERISLIRSHEKFRDSFEQFCLMRYKEFNGYELFSLTQGELRNFWKIIGPTVEVLTGALPFRGRGKMIQHICKNATNLKALRLNNASMSETHISLLCSSLHKIREIDLESSTVDDRAVLALSNLPALEVLKLNNNFAVQGKHLKNLVHLKELSLGFCPWISSPHFIEAIQCMRNLQVLNIYSCRRLDRECFFLMPVHCKKLESLKMHYSGERVNPVTEIAALKTLEIGNLTRTNPIARSFYKSLVEFKSETLEKLTIRDRFGIDHEDARLIAKLSNLTHLNVSGCLIINLKCLNEFAELKHLEDINLSYCGDVEDAGVKTLFRKCLKLRRVDLEFCNQVTPKILEFAAINFRFREKKNLPVVCNVNKTGIVEKEVQKESYYSSSVEYIKLIFEIDVLSRTNGLETLADVIVSDDEYDYDTDEDSDEEFLDRMHMMRNDWYADEDDAMMMFFHMGPF